MKLWEDVSDFHRDVYPWSNSIVKKQLTGKFQFECVHSSIKRVNLLFRPKLKICVPQIIAKYGGKKISWKLRFCAGAWCVLHKKIFFVS